MKHTFAFYFPDLGKIERSFVSVGPGQPIAFEDEGLLYRITRIVRMKPGQVCILFDRELSIELELRSFIGKKGIEGVLLRSSKNRIFKPEITFWLPLLKRDQFEAALYTLVELGANVVQPVITAKTQRKWGGAKELKRAKKIMIGAAEQSKNFAFPLLNKPLSLQECCEIIDQDQKIFFDLDGEPVSHIVQMTDDRPLLLMIGPEGDLIQKEKELLQKKGFNFCSLTPTIIRASQAAVLSVGIFRSFAR